MASNSQNWLVGLVAWGGGAIGFELVNPRGGWGGGLIGFEFAKLVGGPGGLGLEVRLALIWRIRVVAGVAGRLAPNSQNWLAGWVVFWWEVRLALNW